MAKFVPSVAGLPVAKKETVMLKASNNKTTPKAARPRMVAVIKNGHTDAELEEMGERWVNHQGPYLTLAEVIAIEQAKQATKSPESQS